MRFPCILFFAMLPMVSAVSGAPATRASNPRGDFESVLSVMQVASPESLALDRLALALPWPNAQISAEQRRKIDSILTAAEAKMQELVATVQKDPASAPQLVKKGEQIKLAFQQEISHLLTEPQQQELWGRVSLVTGEVLALKDDPTTFEQVVLEPLKLTPAQKKKIHPVLLKGVAQIQKLAQQVEATDGVKRGFGSKLRASTRRHRNPL